MSEGRHAVLIGSSEFPADPRLLQSLRCPLNDVDGFKKILDSKKHGAFTETLVLKNKASYEILPVLNRVLKRAEKSDLVLIYYSGHGKLNPTGALHLATADTQIETLESTSIPVGNIRSYIDASPSSRVVLILDCCYSGRIGETFLKGGVDDQLQQVSGGGSGRGMYILTASTGIQVAQEKERDEYSLLTKYLLEGISDGGADFDDDGLVSVDDLYKYAWQAMRSESFQLPMKWDLNVQGESLIVARTGRAEGERRAEQRDQLLFQRQRFRDRSVIAGLTVGGALGAGVGLSLMRLPIAFAILTSDELILARLFAFFYNGMILGGALTLGSALAGHLWKRTEDTDHPSSLLPSLIRKLRSRWVLATLLGTVLFSVAYLVVSVLGGMPLQSRTAFTALTMGCIAGAGLSLALYGQPYAGIRLGIRGWLWRLVIVGLTFVLLQTPSILDRSRPALVISWGGDFYQPRLAASEVSWQQAFLEHSHWLSYLTAVDAFLVGISLTVGITIGLTRAADALATWLTVIPPDRE